MCYYIIYWKGGLNKNCVKVRKFDIEKDANDFLINSKSEYKEFIFCQRIGEEKDGVTKFRIFNKGAFILLKILAYIVSFMVMVAIIAAFWFAREWLIFK